MRVHELAKELNVSSKDLMDVIQSVLRIEPKNHMAILSPEQVTTMRRLVKPHPVVAPTPVSSTPIDSAPQSAAAISQKQKILQRRPTP